MSIPVALPAGPRPPFTTATPLSSAAWRRIRSALTAGLFAVATVAGIGVGLQGAAVSPVAPTVATAAGATQAAAPGDAPPAGRGGRDHRFRR